MAWTVSFSAAAAKAFGGLDRPIQRRIQKFIDTRLETDQDPRRIGEAYTGPLKGYWKYRIGGYRLICEIQDKAVRIVVIAIGDRKEVYR
jgi:mRNA interferase RelE/StbE